MTPRPQNQPELCKDQQDSPVTESGATEGVLTMKALEAAVGTATLQHRGEGSSRSRSSSSAGQSGSGGGYSADYSSSDCSSVTSIQGKGFQLLVDRLNLGSAGAKISVLTDRTDAHGSRETKPSPKLHGNSYVDQGKKSGPTDCQIANAVSNGNNRTSTNSVKELEPLGPGTQGKLPQWNGIRIQHPMDPRIDISTVQHVRSFAVPGNSSDVLAAANGDQNTVGAVPPSVDHYLHLLEAVRPFFPACAPPMETSPVAQQAPNQDGSGSEAVSSEGFTSFFTTTNSNPTSSDSNSDLKLPAASFNQQETSMTAAKASSSIAPSGSYPASNASIDESDSSSLVVLARIKRKHLKRLPDQSTSSSSNKMVRIAPQERTFAENYHDALQQQPGSLPEGPQEVAAAPADEAPQESSSSSSSEGLINNGAPQGHLNPDLQQGPQGHLHLQQENAGGGLHHYAIPPRVVSESSERNTGISSTTSNTATTGTSGSGSGGNSGSNNGSSGSGNEGKGSSTDNAKGDVNSNSDENNGSREGQAKNEMNADQCKPTAEFSQATGVFHRHLPPLQHTLTVKSPVLSSQYPSTKPVNDAMPPKEQYAVREKKLLDKKRKRMNMRREYEEQVQQQMESSESSLSGTEFSLRPGKPVTLDEVLSFTKAARLVVQATPPFLAVHANAAYTTLSGIDSHFAIGKPISALLSIPDPAKMSHARSAEQAAGGEAMSSVSGNSSTGPSPRQQSLENQMALAQGLNPSKDENLEVRMSETRQEHAAAAALGRARATSVSEDQFDVCLERLVAASGFGNYHVINVTAMPQQIVGRNVTVVHEGPALGISGNGNNRDEQRSQGSSIPSVGGHYSSLICQMGISPVVSSRSAMDCAVVTDRDQASHHHSTGPNTGKHHSVSKRRKHHHVGHNVRDVEMMSSRTHHRRMLTLDNSNQRNAERNTITHYVIQLEPVGGSRRPCGGNGSLSSASTTTTVEARIYGLTKAELRKRRRITNDGDAAAGGEAVVGAAITEPPPQPEQLSNMQDEPEDDIDGASETTDPKEPVSTCG